MFTGVSWISWLPLVLRCRARVHFYTVVPGGYGSVHFPHDPFPQMIQAPRRAA